MYVFGYCLTTLAVILVSDFLIEQLRHRPFYFPGYREARNVRVSLTTRLESGQNENASQQAKMSGNENAAATIAIV